MISSFFCVVGYITTIIVCFCLFVLIWDFSDRYILQAKKNKIKLEAIGKICKSAYIPKFGEEKTNYDLLRKIEEIVDMPTKKRPQNQANSEK